MAQISRSAWQQQFKTTNYIGLVMIVSVFIYAGLVLTIDKGYIGFKIRPTINLGTLTIIKYILLVVALFHYFFLRFFQKFSLKSANYLPPGAIIIFALCETVSIYGLILFFMSGNSMDFYIFMLISLLYFYLFYPKYADWERLWKQG